MPLPAPDVLIRIGRRDKGVWLPAAPAAVGSGRASAKPFANTPDGNAAQAVVDPHESHIACAKIQNGFKDSPSLERSGTPS